MQIFDLYLKTKLHFCMYLFSKDSKLFFLTWTMIKRLLLRGFRIIIWPHSLELIQMVSAQHSPVPGQVLKVVHDDSNEQVNDLKKKVKIQEQYKWSWNLAPPTCSLALTLSVLLYRFLYYQESTESKEADEIEVGQIAATAVLLPWLIIWLGVTPSSWQRCQHNLLPLLSCCTS